MSAALRLLLTGGLLATLLLAGCSSGLDKNQCMLADWTMIGYEDGLQGWPADRIGARRVACARHGVTPNLAAYLEGRERGLAEFCQPKNGFRVGLNGGGYANVCSGPTEPNFVSSYHYGRQIHDARAELRQTNGRLRAARDGVAQTTAAMASATAELVLPDVPVERRAFLATELVRLAQERTELLNRVDQLTQRSQQLAISVQQLERQSPYPI